MLEYLVPFILVSVAGVFLFRRLNRGWNARNTPTRTRSETRMALIVVGIAAAVVLGYELTELTRPLHDYFEKKEAAERLQIETKEAAERAQKAAAERQTRLQDLGSNRTAIIAKINALVASGDLKRAHDYALPYGAANDPEIIALLDAIERQRIAEAERNKVNADKAKIAALETRLKGIDQKDTLQRMWVYRDLVELAPTNKEYSQKLKLYASRSDAEAAQEQAKVKAQKRREGVRIGMSKQDVLDSSWGRPNKVNKTTTVYAAREQWVYGDYGERGFLYFDGDTLTAVQN